METLSKIKLLVEKMTIDTEKLYKKNNQSAAIRARKYAQEIKNLVPGFRKEILEQMKEVQKINSLQETNKND
jgi:hypothetical protein